MGFPLFAWESIERDWEWDSCELARSTVVFSNWHFLLFQHNFGAGLQEYIVEGKNRRVAAEAITHRQSPKIALTCLCRHAHGALQTARDEPTVLVTSHILFVCLCPSLALILHLSHPSLNRWFFSIEILKLALKQQNHPIFPTPLLSSLSSFLPMEVFEVAQVPEKGIFFLPLCFGSVSLLHYIFPLLFCSACLVSVFSTHLSTLLQGSFFINMLISGPGMLLAAHCSPGRARGESQERVRKGERE